MGGWRCIGDVSRWRCGWVSMGVWVCGYVDVWVGGGYVGM